MNEHVIEKLLRNAPPVRTPPGLLKDLQSNIELPRARAANRKPRMANHAFGRWLPALGFALWLLGCIVVLGIQAKQIAELKRATERAALATAAAPESDQVQAQLRLLEGEIEQLRKNVADVQRLRAEVEQLREQTNHLEVFRVQNQQLRSELNSRIAPPPKPEEDFFTAQAIEAARVRCVNNLKQVCLAARLWAHESKTDAMPTQWSDMIQFLGGPERALKLAACPGQTPYEILSLGAPESDPQVVFVRCAAHNIVGMVDGSVQQLGARRVVQRDGKWVISVAQE